MSTAERTRLLRRGMIVDARRRTVAHGLAGFTIDGLCETAGVSRRTFFNHFASKEDVVLGIELGDDDALLQAYAAGDAVPTDLAPLHSIIALAVEQLHRVGFDRADEALVRDVLEREPALVARFMSASDRQLGLVATAVRTRFGWDDADAADRARVVAELAAAVLKASAAQHFGDPDAPPLDDLIHQNLRHASAAIGTTRQESP